MGNEYENVNVRNVRKLMLEMLGSFDRCNVRGEWMNIWGMDMEMLMLGMLGS